MNPLATFTERLASLINSLGTGRPVRPWEVLSALVVSGKGVIP